MLTELLARNEGKTLEFKKYEHINAKSAQEIWQVTRRTTTTRLKEMCNQGLLVDISKSPKDPQKGFVFAKQRK